MEAQDRDRRTAVIGMALRFPGADTPERYWRDIRDGVSHVRAFTEAEFASAGVPEAHYRDPDFVGAGALLDGADGINGAHGTDDTDGIDGFDAEFFGMSGREAALTDPQQRLLLECCHHALEDGGHAGSGARIGMYASVGYRLYSLHSYLAHNIGQGAAAGDGGAAGAPFEDWAAVKQVQIGNYPDFAAGRTAFKLGLDGPAMTVATACSSALVSVHLACQALHAGDADLMVVGSAALHLPQITGHRHVPGSTLSPTGTVRAFDASADGTVGGNGVAALLLKPLAKALADGDTVHAVLLGSAVTNDGADRAGFAAPGVRGQRDAVLGALANAGVRADSIGYLEAHGTGTFKGDPIEFRALTEAFRRHTDRRSFCALGSTKPAIGHLDSAAGLAGLIKAILVLRHGVIPPLVNFSRPNPLLGVAESPFVLPTRAASWTVDGPRRAGVHAIGMGGTNAHVILEEAPAAAPARTANTPVPALLPLSAQSPRALDQLARSLRDTLADRRGPLPADPLPPGPLPSGLLPPGPLLSDLLPSELSPADLLTTLALGRRRLRHRLVLTAPPEDWAGALDAFLRNRPGAGPADGMPPPAGYRTGTVERAGTAAFLFSGQGGGRPGMARALADRFPVVAEVLHECARVHREETGEHHFLDRLLGGEGPRRWDTAFAQPALFALQVAQARLWRTLGVTPSAVAGHSVGEYAALCVAGAVSPEHGMRLVCRRGLLMQGTEPGAMLAVLADHGRVRQLLDALDGSAYGRLELAVCNGPLNHVVAGPPGAVEAARAWLVAHGERSEPLPVDRAFHTALLDPVLDGLREAAGRAELRPVEVTFVSGVDGRARPPGWLPDADHLVRQARRTVDFHGVLRTLAPRGPLLELGPGAPLTGLAHRAVPDASCVPTQGHGPDLDGLWAAVAGLHCAGVDIDWAALLDGCGGRRIPLPTYPFQHRSHWVGPAPRPGPPVGPAPRRTASLEDRMTEQAVLDRVLELTARHLGYRTDEVAAGRTFVGLGADSLQLIGMLRQLEGEFGVRLAVQEVLEEAGTPEGVAALIASRAGTPAPGPARPVAADTAAPVTGTERAGADAKAEPAASHEPLGPQYATREEVAELARQIDLLAKTQSAMLAQLSEAVTLLTARQPR
ncbi:beta-ketoacyl synthase N-terminal-like domain-containing protein [Streptomyces sp. NPDC048664]|uniref:type I polyketide synthase n=1 Tax=Streptomyces sp. NPDC048664 TaxID=3154505 RepID=UPI00341835A8